MTGRRLRRAVIRGGLVLCAVLAFGGMAGAQIRAVSVERLNLGEAREWHAPRFSPDGSRVYVTTPSYGGIWEFTISSGRLRRITSDRGAGYGFTISADGWQIAYRRTVAGRDGRRRGQETVVRDLRGRTVRIAASARRLPLPVFSGSRLIARSDASRGPAGSGGLETGVVLLGIEETKIAILRYGVKELFDPLAGGSYTWPVLSPDRSQLAAYDADRGTFVCDLDGGNVRMLGRRDAPCWTRDGRWIVYMDDRDDGHRLVSSDICAVSPDGGQTVRLTSTSGVHEMYPHCSPAADEIVCSTADGHVLMIRYETAGPGVR